MGLEETKEAINAAAKAFETWSKTSAKVRMQKFRRLAL
jgi:acyl-CoA reductase-like NAD-dependent aldehyde dehydrogenase